MPETGLLVCLQRTSCYFCIELIKIGSCQSQYNTSCHANQFFKEIPEFSQNHPLRGCGGPGSPNPDCPFVQVGDQPHWTEPDSPGRQAAAGP